MDAPGRRQQNLSVVRLAAVASLVLAVACAAPAPTQPAATPHRSAPLAFIEDDFSAASREAARTGKPIFVDAWAPWCHTCLSMKARVLADPALADATLRSGKRLADAFVWLAIDTERVQNTSFVAAHPNRVWPTLYVVESDAKTVRLAWEGSATREELLALLSDVEQGGTNARFAEAVALAASGHPRDAEPRLLAIVDDSSVEAGLRARALEAAIALSASPEQTHARALAALGWMPRSTSRATVLAAALDALDTLEKTDPSIVAAAYAEARATPCATAPHCANLAPDDRSSLFEALVAHTKQREPGRSRGYAREWSTYLEQVAAAARSFDERYAYDAHRLLAAEELAEVPRILPVLEESARRSPRDGNRHARLARAHAALGHDEDALREGRLALDLLEGPRVLRVATTLADLLDRNGKRGEARAVLERALAKLDGFPLTKSQEKLAATCRARAKALVP